MNTPNWKRAHLLAEEAMSSARATDSRAVLPEVCMRHFQATGAPHTLDTRRDYMNDILELTGNDRDPIQRFFALSMAASAAIEAADIVQADAHLDTAFRIARETDVPVLAYNAECIRVWRTGIAGDLGEAERLAFAAMKLGTRNGIDFAVVGPGLQVSNIRWQLGRFAELLPLLRVTATDDDIGASILLARALACTTETKAEATEVVRKAASHEFDDLPRGLHWTGCLIAAAEVAYLLDDAPLGRLVRDVLEPFADGVAFNGTWAIAPIAYGAAIGGAAAGEPTADELFEHAIAVCRRLDAPLLRARTEMAWSRVLTARDDAPTKALSLVSDARGTFAEHRLETFADSADALARHSS
jgi:hypothetical protein